MITAEQRKYLLAHGLTDEQVKAIERELFQLGKQATAERRESKMTTGYVLPPFQDDSDQREELKRRMRAKAQSDAIGWRLPGLTGGTPAQSKAKTLSDLILERVAAQSDQPARPFWEEWTQPAETKAKPTKLEQEIVRQVETKQAMTFEDLDAGRANADLVAMVEAIVTDSAISDKPAELRRLISQWERRTSKKAKAKPSAMATKVREQLESGRDVHLASQSDIDAILTKMQNAVEKLK